MARYIMSVVGSASRVWARLNGFLSERNERAIAAWGSSLQYKRRYTNPDEAKRAREGA